MAPAWFDFLNISEDNWGGLPPMHLPIWSYFGVIAEAFRFPKSIRSAAAWVSLGGYGFAGGRVGMRIRGDRQYVAEYSQFFGFRMRMLPGLCWSGGKFHVETRRMGRSAILSHGGAVLFWDNIHLLPASRDISRSSGPAKCVTVFAGLCYSVTAGAPECTTATFRWCSQSGNDQLLLS